MNIRKNKKGIISPTILVLIILLLVSTSGLFYLLGKSGIEMPFPWMSSSKDTGREGNSGSDDSDEEEQTQQNNGRTNTNRKTYETISMNETWNLYLNEVQGFAIKFPKTAYYSFGGCEFKEDENSYRPVPGTLPVTAITDGNTIYIGNETYYDLTGETRRDNRSFYSGCEEKTSTLANMDNFNQSFWEIKVTEITNDAELLEYIRENYGEGCSIGEKSATTNPSVFDVAIKGDGLGLAETKCPINFAYEMKYNTELNKLANWNRGQACYFYKEGYSECYDQEMTDSFEFID